MSGGEKEGTISEGGRTHLVVLQGPSFGDVYDLDERARILGSDPFRADVVVRDAEVEPRHARICREPGSGEYALRDLGTGDGIAVNGEAVEETRHLRCGDRISVGNSVLEFVEDDPVRERFHHEMQRLINEDDLTGLFAKGRFDEEFERSLEAAREREIPLSVLMVDVDNLKSINDTHGHLLGEFTVGEIGRVIRESRNAGERLLATRFGGDEYQILLPGLGKEEALTAGEEIRRRVEEYSFEREGVYANPTLSIGVATYPEDGATLDALTRAADEALYRAKDAGGNTVNE